MTAKIYSVTFEGLEAVNVTVEAHIANGIAGMTIVGLPNKAVSEAKERIRACFSTLGLSLPAKRITINLSPADLPKMGSHFDLPIALAILSELEIIPKDRINTFLSIGELGLDGEIKPVVGILPAAISANSLNLGLICPFDNGSEACWAGENFEIIAPKTLLQLIEIFKNNEKISRPKIQAISNDETVKDFCHVKGQETAKRALEIAAAGGHHLLMVGPPGIGKSMLASRLPGILPPLTTSEIIDISSIYSIAGLIKDGKLTNKRPFRSPHHSASQAAIIGGGHHAKPGEVSLAHCGVLFADELPEFSSHVLDSLRQPIETGEVMIARANYHVKYPARFQLIAAMNPCKCGYGQASGYNCGRGANCEAQYRSRISGPMLERFDIFLPLTQVTVEELESQKIAEESKIIQQRVSQARNIQQQRSQDFTKQTNSSANSLAAKFLPSTLNVYLCDELLVQSCQMEDKAKKLLLRAVDHFNFSARAYHRCMRLARTIADLDVKDIIHSEHMAEAINFKTPYLSNISK